ncbi:unnamed protein product [Boreogadus saida]
MQCYKSELTKDFQLKAGVKTERKSCNRSPGKAKEKDPLRGMKGLEDLPVKTQQLLKGLVKNLSKPFKKKPSCSSGQGSLPGERSSSLPLKMPASDGMLGKAKEKDPLRGMKGLEDLPVETQQLLKGLVKNLSKPFKKKPSCSSGQGSLPGERSSSLPLKMPASDGDAGELTKDFQLKAGVKTERKSGNRSPGKAKAKDPLRGMKGLEDLPVETQQLLKGKAKEKDPLRGMKGLEDLPVETQQLLKGLVKNLSKPFKKKPSCSSGQGSLPGERSSSLPLKMPASDGMLELVNVAREREVWGPLLELLPPRPDPG